MGFTFIPLALLLPKAFHCLTVSAFVSDVCIEKVIMSIFLVSHPPIFYDRTKIKLSH